MRGQPGNPTYDDTGCDLRAIDERCATCLTCPLPACKDEMGPGEARMMLRAMKLRALVREGWAVEDAAHKLGLSRRTGFRLVKEG